MPASSPGNTANCYAELAVSSPQVAETIVNAHCTNTGQNDITETAYKHSKQKACKVVTVGLRLGLHNCT